MEFETLFTIYTSAIDSAKETKHKKIIQFFSKGPIQSDLKIALSRIDSLNAQIAKLEKNNIRIKNH